MFRMYGPKRIPDCFGTSSVRGGRMPRAHGCACPACFDECVPVGGLLAFLVWEGCILVRNHRHAALCHGGNRQAGVHAYIGRYS